MVWSLTATYYEWFAGYEDSGVIALFDDLSKLEAYIKTPECKARWVDKSDKSFYSFQVHRWVVNEIPERYVLRDGYHPRHRDYSADGELMEAGEDSE